VSGTVGDFRHAANQNGIEHSMSPTLTHDENGNLAEPTPVFVGRTDGDYRLDQGRAVWMAVC
jgi:hypothetical protein